MIEGCLFFSCHTREMSWHDTSITSFDKTLVLGYKVWGYKGLDRNLSAGATVSGFVMSFRNKV